MERSKSKLAVWVVAGVLALGTGIALAETAPEDPVVDDGTEEGAGDDAVLEQEADTDGGGEEEPVDGEDGEESGEGGEHPDNHGKVVSEAAHEHAFDEACGNHGAYVSAVARTG